MVGDGRRSQGAFRHRPHAGDRALQVVGDVARDVLELANQWVDAIQHLVEGARQVLDLLALAPHRDASGQVAPADLHRGRGDAIHTGHRAARHEPAQQQARNDRGRPAEREDPPHHPEQLLVVSQRGPELEEAAIGHPPHDRACPSFRRRNFNCSQGLLAWGESPQVGRGELDPLPRRQIRGGADPQLRIEQDAEFPAGVRGIEILPKRRHPLRPRCGEKLAFDLARILAKLVVDAAREVGLKREVDQEEGGQREDREEPGVPQGETERDRTEEARTSLRGHSPPRGWYESTGEATRDRSSLATGKSSPRPRSSEDRNCSPKPAP